MNFNLATGFYESSLRWPDNIALAVRSREYTYRQLRETVQPVSDWLVRHAPEKAPRVGMLGSRNLASYAGILGVCWAGGTYVPISPKLPKDRLIQLLGCVQLQALVVDSDGLKALTKEVLAHCPTAILAPERPASEEIRLPGGVARRIAGSDQLKPFDVQDQPSELPAEHVGYIIFTSGTTGVPKGVMIPASAVAHFVSVMQSRFALQPADRVAGMTEITFDISVSDMFTTWSCGASLRMVPSGQLVAPAGFIRREACTMIFTVPSVISGMRKMKMLARGSMPTLRYSFFVGEPLPVASALQWMEAASNSVVEDLYGPTEATVVCTGQRFTGPENATPNRGVVAIGKPFPGMEAAIVDPLLRFVPNGEHGELLVAGPQLSSGYFGTEEFTSVRYPILSGKRWYRTGDLAYCDDTGVFHHLGRIDNQVKVRGRRVELEEIEYYLREVYRSDAVAAVAWPVEHGSANGVVAFVSGQRGGDAHELRMEIKKKLPIHMVPSTVHFVDSLPLSVNGKVDRKVLVSMLSEGRL